MEAGDGEGVEEVARAVELVEGLAAGACHDVDSDERVGDELLDAEYLVAEEGCVVAAAHEAQHFVRTALERYVEVGHECP